MNRYDRKELIIVAVLTVMIAIVELSGIPSILFIHVDFYDIDPIYFALMVNFILIGLLSYLVLTLFCKTWHLGLGKNNIIAGLKKHGLVGFIAGLISLFAFYIGLRPFDQTPSLLKVLIQGVLYYIGVGIIEELYIRGFLLNLLERLLHKNKNAILIAVLLSSFIFGVGHIFSSLNQSALKIICNVIWTIGMGIYFGMVYKKTNNLWVPIIMHSFTNLCALPYCFSNMSGYADISLYAIFPTYLLLGVYSLYVLKRNN